MHVLLIDNYDSFTYNLEQLLGLLGASVQVVRNDRLSPEDALGQAPDRILISPGPGGPSHAGVCEELIRKVAGRIPLLGVCLGHQCLASIYGARVLRGSKAVHGKTSMIENDGLGVFTGLPRRFRAARYHSLVVEESSLPKALVVSARSEDGVIMGLRHESLPLEGVQFHPESFMSQAGRELMENFLAGRIGGGDGNGGGGL